MAVPKTKKELFEQSRDNYQKLNDLINSFPEDDKLAEFPPGTMNRNIRDVLAHLYHWHLMFLDWYSVGMKGEKPEMPTKGYSWKDTKALNKEIWKKYRSRELNEIRSSLDKTHSKLQKIIEKHTEQDLFEKQRYTWTGTSSLATYIRSNTLSHYSWAYKLIKKAKKG
jgi:hypothetical protein